MEYKKILVAVERSPQGRAVFEHALEIAKQSGASLMLFHCLPIESLGISPYTNLYGQELANFSQAIQEQLKQETEEVQQWLDGYCQKSTEQGVPIESNLKLGDAGSWIHELAYSWNADLIVLGRRGRQGLAEMFLGSVSNYVVHHAPCSVLVVQGIQPSKEKNEE
ncbi:MAG: universal stress protein [Xenococcaceae cyanobacterium]